MEEITLKPTREFKYTLTCPAAVCYVSPFAFFQGSEKLPCAVTIGVQQMIRVWMKRIWLNYNRLGRLAQSGRCLASTQGWVRPHNPHLQRTSWWPVLISQCWEGGYNWIPGVSLVCFSPGLVRNPLFGSDTHIRWMASEAQHVRLPSGLHTHAYTQSDQVHKCHHLSHLEKLSYIQIFC